MGPVRVRFAPSPTGYLHIGGVRTALFNWLFARHEKGVFILRIEDTDRERSTPEAIQAILDGLIKGRVTFDNAQLDDLIILRSNGLPTYNFGAVVDDAVMRITHVIRGDDHLNNPPRQILLSRALGYDPPHFGHLPMILGPDKVKLSKRHGATSVLEYQEAGYLPEALVNYLVRLGWSYGDQEVFTVPEMIEKFTLDRINKAPAAFDPEKLLWLNSHYLKHADVKRVADLLVPTVQ